MNIPNEYIAKTEDVADQVGFLTIIFFTQFCCEECKADGKDSTNIRKVKLLGFFKKIRHNQQN